MDDSIIVELYWQRSEDAIRETEKKYDTYCYRIANNILPNREDARECVSDTYLAAWNAIPPSRPAILSTFLGKLTRRISIDRWRSLTAEKRGGSAVTVVLEELQDCVPGGSDPEKELEAKELAGIINHFLLGIPQIERKIFLLRYFDLSPIQEICENYGMSESKIKSMLHRTRKKLRTYLQKEGY